MATVGEIGYMIADTVRKCQLKLAEVWNDNVQMHNQKGLYT